jgi:hypothetical protein
VVIVCLCFLFWDCVCLSRSLLFKNLYDAHHEYIETRSSILPLPFSYQSVMPLMRPEPDNTLCDHDYASIHPSSIWCPLNEPLYPEASAGEVLREEETSSTSSQTYIDRTRLTAINDILLPLRLVSTPLVELDSVYLRFKLHRDDAACSGLICLVVQYPGLTILNVFVQRVDQDFPQTKPSMRFRYG